MYAKINRALAAQRSLGLLLLRVGVGSSMVYYHGWPHLMGGEKIWTGLGEALGVIGIHVLPTFFGFLAAASESIGAALLVLGLGTRVSAFFLFMTMAVAVLMHHFTGKGDPSHAFELGAVFMALIFLGPGKISIDALLRVD